MITDLMENERLDDLQRNGLKIIQKTDGFCFGMDAVLLSGFASVKPGERALDLGTGTGIIPLLLSAKTKGDHFTGLEIQTEINSAKSEAYMMLVLPLVLVIMMSTMGSGFMDSLFTTAIGRIAATVGVICTFVSYVIATRAAEIDV